MMASHRLFRLIPVLVVVALAGAAACNSPAPGPTPKSGGGKQVDAATAGSLSGKVTLSGKPPANEPLRLGTDPACLPGAGPNPVSDAVLVAGDGSVKNVFVYVKDGLDPAYSFTPPTTAVILDQKGCRYAPRVIGAQVGQPVDIVNSDQTMHNVHAIPKVNDEFNSSQPMQGIRTTKTFTKPEVMVLFRCNVHNWMSAYVGVLPHPYFAVTNDGGAFEIKNLPPGTYTIAAWHETFGTQEAKVTIGDKQAQTVSFTFAPKTTTN